MLRSSILAVLMLVPASTLAQFYGTGEPRAANVASSSGALSPRTTVVVDCSNPRARVRTITDGLRMLGDSRPATLLVSGACHENIYIQGLDRITIQGNPTATIDGGVDPNLGTVELVDSSSIDLVDLTVTGGGEGVGCVQCLGRLTRVTVRGSLGIGVSAGARSQLVLSDSFVRNNADAGILVGNAATVSLFGTSVSDNGAGGAFLNAAATLLVVSSSIGGNSGHGIDASLHATVVLNGASVTGNAADGMNLQGSSAMRMTRSTVTGNQGHQVRIGDLSLARFGAANTVGGATYPDVLCDGAFPATRGISTLSAATTNCPGEPASSP